MIEKAVTQRWPISDRFKSATVNRLMQVIADPDSSNRAVASATRAIAAMEGQNQKDEHHATPRAPLVAIGGDASSGVPMVQITLPHNGRDEVSPERIVDGSVVEVEGLDDPFWGE